MTTFLTALLCVLQFSATQVGEQATTTADKGSIAASHTAMHQRIRRQTLQTPATRPNFNLAQSTKNALQDPRINKKKSRAERLLQMIHAVWQALMQLAKDPRMAASNLFVRWLFLSLALAAALLMLLYSLRHLLLQRRQIAQKISQASSGRRLRRSLFDAQKRFARGQTKQALRLATEAWIDLLRRHSAFQDAPTLTLDELRASPAFTKLAPTLRQAAGTLFALYTDSILANRSLNEPALDAALKTLQHIENKDIFNSKNNSFMQTDARHSPTDQGRLS